jgi:hypothetical protein
MNSEPSKRTELKKKIAHELSELVGIALYLAFFFCAVATYRMLLLNEFRVSYFNYGAELLNALVVAKVILIGEYAELGKKHEAKPILISAFHKAFLFSLLVFGFHIVEEAVKRLWHGVAIAGVFHDLRIEDVLARTLIIFCTFVPLFGFLELRRVLGEETFDDMLF